MSSARGGTAADDLAGVETAKPGLQRDVRGRSRRLNADDGVLSTGEKPRSVIGLSEALIACGRVDGGLVGEGHGRRLGFKVADPIELTINAAVTRHREVASV